MIKLSQLSFFVFVVFLAACSSVQIRPQQASGSRIDSAGEQIRQAAAGIEVSIKLLETSVRPSPSEQNYSSFWVEVKNQRQDKLPVSFRDFVLLDDQNRQFQPVASAELVERLTETIPYLIPYPYVGFYYLQDQVSAVADTRLRSESAYYTSRRPEYLTAEALPETAILPAAQVAGAIYFAAELRQMHSFRLQYRHAGLAGQPEILLDFPFLVEKK